MTKVSDVIAALQEFQTLYGDLPFVLYTHTDKCVTMYSDIYYAHNTFGDGTSNISMQSFPY